MRETLKTLICRYHLNTKLTYSGIIKDTDGREYTVYKCHKCGYAEMRA